MMVLKEDEKKWKLFRKRKEIRFKFIFNLEFFMFFSKLIEYDGLEVRKEKSN